MFPQAGVLLDPAKEIKIESLTRRSLGAAISLIQLDSSRMHLGLMQTDGHPAKLPSKRRRSNFSAEISGKNLLGGRSPHIQSPAKLACFPRCGKGTCFSSGF